MFTVLLVHATCANLSVLFVVPTGILNTFTLRLMRAACYKMVSSAQQSQQTFSH